MGFENTQAPAIAIQSVGVDQKQLFKFKALFLHLTNLDLDYFLQNRDWKAWESQKGGCPPSLVLPINGRLCEFSSNEDHYILHYWPLSFKKNTKITKLVWWVNMGVVTYQVANLTQSNLMKHESFTFRAWRARFESHLVRRCPTTTCFEAIWNPRLLFQNLFRLLWSRQIESSTRRHAVKWHTKQGRRWLLRENEMKTKCGFWWSLWITSFYSCFSIGLAGCYLWLSAIRPWQIDDFITTSFPFLMISPLQQSHDQTWELPKTPWAHNPSP